MTWLFEKNISLAAAGDAYLRALYHIYNQFAGSGTWNIIAEVIDVSDADNFTSETTVTSGDWFVLRFYNKVASQTIEVFFGGITAAGILGPYAPSAAGLYVSMGFTGGWEKTIGFTKDSGILLLSAAVAEPWELHFLTQIDRCCFILIGSTNGTSTPEVLDIGVYCGAYDPADSDDNYYSMILVGDPSGVASNKWNNFSVPVGKSYEATKNIMTDLSIKYIADATMLGKDGNNLIRDIIVYSVSGGLSMGTLGAMYGVYQCRNTGIASGDTGTFGGITYYNSHRIAVVWS